MDASTAEVTKVENEIQAAMKRLIEIDPDAITRIEKVFRKVKIERIVEKRLN